MGDDILTVDWQALERLPAAERAKRASELQETANDVKKELARVSATAIKELNDSGMPRAEIAAMLGISVQRVGQLLGPDSRPDGVNMAHLRTVAEVLAAYVSLGRTARRQVEEARRVLSKSGRVSTREARGTAARLAYAARGVTPDILAEVPEPLRGQYSSALAHVEDVRL
jgi:DNA-binding transcriptional regulator YiaG